MTAATPDEGDVRAVVEAAMYDALCKIVGTDYAIDIADDLIENLPALLWEDSPRGNLLREQLGVPARDARVAAQALREYAAALAANESAVDWERQEFVDDAIDYAASFERGAS